LKKLANGQISELILKELPRSKLRLDDLQRRYPSAGTRELAQRLMDVKKNLAGMLGGVSGVFGLVSVPADLLLMRWLELVLLIDVASLHKVNLQTARARRELIELFGYANGIGSMQRAGPKVLGQVATVLLKKGGLSTLGRAVPLVAAPVSAYLNSEHLQRVGEEGVRYYGGFEKVEQKRRAPQRPKASGE
jgi:hypothetical protein